MKKRKKCLEMTRFFLILCLLSNICETGWHSIPWEFKYFRLRHTHRYTLQFRIWNEHFWRPRCISIMFLRMTTFLRCFNLYLFFVFLWNLVKIRFKLFLLGVSIYVFYQKHLFHSKLTVKILQVDRSNHVQNYVRSFTYQNLTKVQNTQKITINSS